MNDIKEAVKQSLDEIESEYFENPKFDGKYNYENLENYKYEKNDFGSTCKTYYMTICEDVKYDLVCVRDISGDVLVLVNRENEEVEWACHLDDFTLRKNKKSDVGKIDLLNKLNSNHRLDQYYVSSFSLCSSGIYFDLYPRGSGGVCHTYDFDFVFDESDDLSENEDKLDRLRVASKI